VHRVVQRLLHQPTVRVRELAAGPGGQRYAALLRELFDLDVPSAESVDGVPEVAEWESPE
jgi:glutamyl-tRNA reductase